MVFQTINKKLLELGPSLQRWSEIIVTTTKNGIVLVATSN